MSDVVMNELDNALKKKEKYINGDTLKEKANAFGIYSRDFDNNQNIYTEYENKNQYFHDKGFDDAEIEFFQKHKAIVPSFDFKAEEPKRGICSRKPINTRKLTYDIDFKKRIQNNTNNIKKDWESVIDYEILKDLKYPVDLEKEDLKDREMIELIDHQFDGSAKDVTYNSLKPYINKEYRITNDYYGRLNDDEKKVVSDTYNSLSRAYQGAGETIYSDKNNTIETLKKHPLNRPHVSYTVSYNKDVAIKYLNNLFDTNYSENDKLDSKTLLNIIRDKKDQIVKQKNNWLNTKTPNSVINTNDEEDSPKVKFYIASRRGSTALNTGCDPTLNDVPQTIQQGKSAEILSFPPGSQFKVLGAKEEGNTVAVYLSTLTVKELKEKEKEKEKEEKEKEQKVIDYENAQKNGYPVALENKNLTEEEMITIIDHQFDKKANDVIYNDKFSYLKKEYRIAIDYYNGLKENEKKEVSLTFGCLENTFFRKKEIMCPFPEKSSIETIKKHPLNRPHVSYTVSYDKDIAINYLNNLFETHYTENDKLDSKTLLENIQGKKGQIVEQKNHWLNTKIPTESFDTLFEQDSPKVKFYIASRMGSMALNTGCNPLKKEVPVDFSMSNNAEKLSFPPGTQFKVLGAKEEKDNTVAIYLSTLTVDEMKENENK